MRICVPSIGMLAVHTPKGILKYNSISTDGSRRQQKKHFQLVARVCNFLNNQLRLGAVFGVEQSDLIEMNRLTADKLRMAEGVKRQYTYL